MHRNPGSLLQLVAGGLWLVVLSGEAAGQAGARAPRDLVRRAVDAMGGEQALRGLRSTMIDFQSASFGLGQEETPESPPRATLGFGRITTEWAGRRQLLSQELRAVSGAVILQRRVMAGGIGMTETNGQPGMMAPGAVAAVETGMRLAPERFLLSALDQPGGLRPLPARRWRGELTDGVRYAIGPDTMTLWFDRPTGLLLASERVMDDPILGDRRTVTWYTRWQAAGGIKLPRQVDTEVNGRLLSHNVVTAASVNQDAPDSLFMIPDSMAARANRGPATPPVVSVTLNELAPGVWRAEGGNHFSLVVDQGAGLAVVEAPIGRARFGAVLDTLRSRFPSKRVTTVVMTHHHWDHSGGIRTALAAGIPIVAHERNRAFVRRVAEARKTITPDALRTPGGVLVRGVADSVSVGTGTGRLVLYSLPSAHAEGILAAYLPSARLLFVSDVLSPPAQPGQTLAPAGSAELVAFVRARGIPVDRVVGGHGGVAAWADVEAAGTRD